MASPDERQGDHTASTTCYVCSEVLRSESAAVTVQDLSLRLVSSARSCSSRKSISIAEEDKLAPIAVPPDDAPEETTLELGLGEQ